LIASTNLRKQSLHRRRKRMNHGNFLGISYGGISQAHRCVDLSCRPSGTSALISAWPSQDQAWVEARAAAYHVVLTATLRPLVLSAALCSVPSAEVRMNKERWFERSLVREMSPWDFWLVRIQWHLVLDCSKKSAYRLGGFLVSLSALVAKEKRALFNWLRCLVMLIMCGLFPVTSRASYACLFPEPSLSWGTLFLFVAVRAPATAMTLALRQHLQWY
jgi:hypothetical protein